MNPSTPSSLRPRYAIPRYWMCYSRTESKQKIYKGETSCKLGILVVYHQLAWCYKSQLALFDAPRVTIHYISHLTIQIISHLTIHYNRLGCLQISSSHLTIHYDVYDYRSFLAKCSNYYYIDINYYMDIKSGNAACLLALAWLSDSFLFVKLRAKSSSCPP